MQRTAVRGQAPQFDALRWRRNAPGSTLRASVGGPAAPRAQQGGSDLPEPSNQRYPDRGSAAVPAAPVARRRGRARLAQQHDEPRPRPGAAVRRVALATTCGRARLPIAIAALTPTALLAKGAAVRRVALAAERNGNDVAALAEADDFPPARPDGAARGRVNRVHCQAPQFDAVRWRRNELASALLPTMATALAVSPGLLPPR